MKAENIAASAFGLRGAGASGAAQGVPYNGEQGAGAFIAIAIFAVWSARRHLGAVFRKALHPGNSTRDDDEPLSYRTAVFGLVASFSALVLFASLGGLSARLAATFFGLYLVMILACSRIRGEAGPMLGYGPDMNPHRMMTLIPGTRNWNAGDLTAFSYFQWFDSDYRSVAMPQQMEAFKIAEGSSISPRRLARWMMLAGIAAAVASFISVLAIYYHYGADTPRGDNGWRSWNGRFPFATLMDWLQNPRGPNPLRLEWMGIGFALTAALLRARMAFVWWPFHPAGFAMAQAGAALQWIWFATLIGWGAKAFILKWSGMRGFRRCIPFFMGLILGDFVVAVLWSILGLALDQQMYMFFPG